METTPTADPRAVTAGPAYVWSRAALVIGLLAILPGGVAILAASLPGGDFGLLVVASVLWLPVGLAWIAALVASRGQRHALGRPQRSFALAPAVVVLTVALAISGLPLTARFAISRSALERLPDLGLSNDESASVGLYSVCCFERTDFGYRFGVSQGLNVVWGFAYSPNGPPAGPDIDSGLREGDNAYRHLDGPWYIWELLVT